MMMRGLLLVRSQSHLEHPKIVVLEQNLMVRRRSDDSVERRVPRRGVQIRKRFRYGVLPSLWSMQFV
jgi:hypothetical protein